MSTDAFIEESYEAPSSGGNYTKFPSGETRLRILSSPLMVWVLWSDAKPSRLPYNKEVKPPMPTGEKPSVKHAWLLSVYNYTTSQIEILELSLASIITPILSHSRDEDWGHPKHYDIVIKKEGSGREGTKYTFVAKPKKPVSQEVMDAYFATPIDLKEMLKPDGNPFLSAPEAPKTEAPKTEAPKTEAPKTEAPKADGPPF